MSKPKTADGLLSDRRQTMNPYETTSEKQLPKPTRYFVKLLIFGPIVGMVMTAVVAFSAMLYSSGMALLAFACAFVLSLCIAILCAGEAYLNWSTYCGETKDGSMPWIKVLEGDTKE